MHTETVINECNREKKQTGRPGEDITEDLSLHFDKPLAFQYNPQ